MEKSWKQRCNITPLDTARDKMIISRFILRVPIPGEQDVMNFYEDLKTLENLINAEINGRL